MNESDKSFFETVIQKNFSTLLPPYKNIPTQQLNSEAATPKKTHRWRKNLRTVVLVGTGAAALIGCDRTPNAAEQSQTRSTNTNLLLTNSPTPTSVEDLFTATSTLRATSTPKNERNLQDEINQGVKQTLTALVPTTSKQEAIAQTVTAVLAGETATSQAINNSATDSPTTQPNTATPLVAEEPSPLPTELPTAQPLHSDCNPGDFGILYEKSNYQGIGVRIRQPYTKDLVYEAKNQSNPTADQYWGSFRKCRGGYVVYLYTGTILGGQYIVVDRNFSSFDQTTLPSGEVESSFATLLLRDFPEDRRITPPKCPPGALYGLYAEQDYQGESIFFSEEIFNVPFKKTGAVVECADAPGSERRALLIRGEGGVSLISESMSKIGISTQVTDVTSARPEILQPKRLDP